jgi:hypothetical protein
MDLLQRIFPDIDAQFPTPYSPYEAARRLAERVKPTVEETGSFKALVGSVTVDRVHLACYHPSKGGRLGAWVFSGAFKVENGKTVLLGRFAKPWSAKIWPLFLFGPLGTFMVVGLAAGNLGMALAPVGVVAFGVLAVLYQRIGLGDPDHISKVIRKVLATPSARDSAG